jgi:hypothetical protein
MVTIIFDNSARSTFRPSIRMEQLGSHWTDFHEILHFSIFLKYVRKIQI